MNGYDNSSKAENVAATSPGSLGYGLESANTDNGDYTYSQEDDDQSDQGQDGPRKKQRLEKSRPICTNCSECQIRKGKCDRGRPRCGWCTVNDKLCEYKERKKPGLRAGYGRDLERRLFRVEELLETHSQLLGEVKRKARLKRKDSSLEETSDIILDLQSPTALDFQQPPLSQTQQSPPALHPHQSDGFGVQNASPILIATSGHEQIPKAPNATSNGTHKVNSNVDQTFQLKELPPYDLLYKIVELYFTHVNSWCPILDRKSTLNRLFGTNVLKEDDRMLLHAMVATTLRFSTDVRLTEHGRREQYHDTAKQKVLLYGLENNSVRGLQALVILALDYVGSSNSGAGLKLIATLARSVIQLGLATESYSPCLRPDYPSISTLRANTLPEPGDWIEDEERRRLFWSIYVLDRDATVATAFDFALRDDSDVDRKLPCRDDLFARNQVVNTRWFRTAKRTDYTANNSQNLGTFSYLVEVKGILSRIHKFLKEPMDVSALTDVERWQASYRELDATLRSWQLSLPNEYGNMARLSKNPIDSQRSPLLTSGWIILQASYYLALIRLHSSAAYPPHKSPIFGPSYAAGQQCFSSVENIIALTRYAVENNMLFRLGSLYAFALWVAARVLIVHGSTIETYVSQDIHFLVDTLRKIGQHWPIAVRYATILQRVMDEYQESLLMTSLPKGQKAAQPSSVETLADMRRCAYDLDYLISNHQPRHKQSEAVPPQQLRGSAPSEMDYQYLETFDFFNYPRLATPLAAPEGSIVDPNLQRFDASQLNNITNFSLDINSDWLAGNFT